MYGGNAIDGETEQEACGKFHGSGIDGNADGNVGSSVDGRTDDVSTEAPSLCYI